MGRGRAALVAAVLGSAVAGLDANAVGLALPAIGREFGSGLAGLQWVVSAYAVTLAGLLLPGGALGDRLGRRRAFALGLVGFALASLVCAAATGPAMLVTGRALQGTAAAVLTPGSLALLEVSYPEADRPRMIGFWSGLAGMTQAAGPLLGGWLTGAASWRWIFAVNLPVAAVALLALRRVPPTPRAAGGSDRTGTLLVTAGLAGLAGGLIEGPSRGWADPLVLAGFTLGLGGLAGFAVREHLASTPILPPGLFGSRRFRVVSLVTVLVYAGLGGLLFLLPMTLQLGLGYGPLRAGLALLPFTAVMLLLSARSGALAERIGPYRQLVAGPVLAGAGMALFARAGEGWWAGVLPAALVLGAGMAATVAPLTATALDVAPDRFAGVAAAVNLDLTRVAGLTAVAVLPLVAGIGADVGTRPGALTAGLPRAALVAGGLCLLAGAVAAAGLRPHRARDTAGRGSLTSSRPARSRE